MVRPRSGAVPTRKYVPRRTLRPDECRGACRRAPRRHHSMSTPPLQGKSARAGRPFSSFCIVCPRRLEEMAAGRSCTATTKYQPNNKNTRPAPTTKAIPAAPPKAGRNVERRRRLPAEAARSRVRHRAGAAARGARGGRCRRGVLALAQAGAAAGRGLAAGRARRRRRPRLNAGVFDLGDHSTRQSEQQVSNNQPSLQNISTKNALPSSVKKSQPSTPCCGDALRT